MKRQGSTNKTCCLIGKCLTWSPRHQCWASLPDVADLANHESGSADRVTGITESIDALVGP